MKNIERYAYLGIIVLLLVLLMGEKCNVRDCPPCPEVPIVKIDTIVKSDTVYKPSPSGFIPGTESWVPINVPVKDQTESMNGSEWDFFIEPGEPEPVVPQNYSRVYNDTLRLDSLGFVNLKDTISSTGEILSRSFNWQLFPRTTVAPVIKRKNQWFAGPELMGNQRDPLQYAGVDLMMIGRSGRTAYNVGAGRLLNEWMFKAGVKFKIGK